MPDTTPQPPDFAAPISRRIWDLKYRLRGADGSAIDSTLDDTFWRVARAAAANEKGGKRGREKLAQRFHDAIADFGFLPAMTRLVMAHSRIGPAFGQLFAQIMFAPEGKLSRAEREMVAAVASGAQDCLY